jgi:hypothetical protein
MDEHSSGRRDRPENRQPNPYSGEGKQFLLKAEEQILQSISGRAPLPELLNRICSALDIQIGNVVSLISLPGDDADELTAIAGNAALFGLYAFCSGSVVDESDELLGSLEMYCSIPRRPSDSEFQLIERAMCLAAIAIKLGNKADHQGNCGARGKRAVPEHVAESSDYVN